MGAQYALAVRNLKEVFVEFLLGIYDGTYLEQVVATRLVGMYIACHLNLNGTAHLLLTKP